MTGVFVNCFGYLESNATVAQSVMQGLRPKSKCTVRGLWGENWWWSCEGL